MKHISLFLFFLCFTVQIWAQESTILNRITLNNGTVYIGEIVVKTSEMVMIKTQSGTRFQFQLSEVKKIDVLTESESKAQTTNQTEPLSEINGNYCLKVELSGGIIAAKNSFDWCPASQVSLLFGNKNMVGKNVFLGFGVGYSALYLPNNADAVNFLPVFLRLQSTLTKDRTAPFIGIDAGYTFGLSSDYDGGLMVKLSAGITHKINFKTSLYAGVFAGITSINGNLIVTNDLGTFSYIGQTSMTDLGLKVGLQF